MTNDITEFKQFFDPIFNRFLKQKRAQAKRILSDPVLLQLVEQGIHVALAGGKRIRPYLAYLMYQTGGGKKTDRVNSLLIGLELVHTFALIHDDIMDQAKTRHGVDTVHQFALGLLKKEKRLGDLEHIAQSQAILVGDVFMSWAAELLMEYPEAKAQFSSLMNELILGQMIDVDAATRSTVTAEQIRRRLILKSARYSFVQPMLFGCIAADTHPNLYLFSEKFGTALGIAFQVQDDLLDFSSTAQKLHKPVMGDLEEGQHTFFTQYIFDHGTPQQKRELQSLFRSQLTPTDQPRVIKFFEDSGAIKYGNGLITKHFATAEKLLGSMKMPERFSAAWQDLITLLKNRSS